MAVLADDKAIFRAAQTATTQTLGASQSTASASSGAVSSITGQAITGTTRIASKEAEALALGYSKEYINSRGGINAAGYWNDVPLSGQLTQIEQMQVRNPDGTTNTQAMADILQKKQIAEKIAQGMSVADATAEVTKQYGKYALSTTSTGTSTGLDANGNPVSNGVGTMTAGDMALSSILKSYGLEGIASTIAKIRADYPEASSDDLLALAKTDSRYNAEYLKRFAGNKALMDKGLPTISDAEYLKAEDEYKKIFTAYGATGLANKDYYATLIGNRMDAVDVTERMNQAYARYQATPEIKKAFNAFYQTVTDGDVLAVMLDPTTQLPILQKKITAAEIGGAALAQGLETSLVRAEDLAGWNVTGATAQAGYSTIAQKLPRGQFLSEISPETGVKYTQATAEDIQFKKNAAAKRQEDILIGTEIGRFGGSAGIANSKSLASQARGAGLV